MHNDTVTVHFIHHRTRLEVNKVVSQQSLGLAYDDVFSYAIVPAFDGVFASCATNRNLKKDPPAAARAPGVVLARDSVVPRFDSLVRIRNLDCPEVLEHRRNSFLRKNNCEQRIASVARASTRDASECIQLTIL